jgi:transcriptional regulator of PTS gene
LALQNDIGTQNRNSVLTQIMQQPAISRSAIGMRLNLNAASVSRITRDLIDAGLVRETGVSDPEGRPGRRFIGLSPHGPGGYIIGIGLNAFRQSVTLADLENTKIAEWVSEATPKGDGAAFLRICIEKAAGMVAAHVTDPTRLFGIGIAVAADLDKDAGIILRAPTFGWTDPINVQQIVDETLKIPLALEMPSLAINMAEADFGVGKGIANLATLHCSLGFGIGVRKSEASGEQVNFGRVLNSALTPDGSGRKLDAICGGVSILNQVMTAEAVAQKSDSELGAILVDLIQKSRDRSEIATIFEEKARLTAQYMSLTLDIIRPELLLLGGPLAVSDDYVAGFTSEFQTHFGTNTPVPTVSTTPLTPTGASRFLALRAHVLMGNLDLAALKRSSAA